MFRFLFAISLVLTFMSKASAQTKITFNINLRPQIEDSTFNPDRDEVVLRGNRLPFSKTRTIRLRDKEPVDSVYSVAIDFPSMVNDKFLEYRFIIKSPDKDIEENQSRLIRLEGQNEIIPAALFNLSPHN